MADPRYERDEWLEMLEAQVGKKLAKVEKRKLAGDDYYRLTFDDGANFEWHGALQHREDGK
jgi:hypothetical protein